MTGCKNFVGKKKKFILNAFIDFKAVERFENGSNYVRIFRTLNNSTSKRVLDLLEPVKLIVWKVVIERVTVIKFSGQWYRRQPIDQEGRDMKFGVNL